MSGRSPRWIQKPDKTIKVTLAGTLSSMFGYATIDGTKYTSAQTVRGTTIRFYVGGLFASSSCRVTLDGVVVQSGAGTYQYTGSKNITATFSASGGSNYTYYTCDIVTV